MIGNHLIDHQSGHHRDRQSEQTQHGARRQVREQVLGAPKHPAAQ